jgi:2-keto-4-pentenoate hydratase/2-oxohepta-3-ene-1,7-dioic acid hydratase in catechol pathway
VKFATIKRGIHEHVVAVDSDTRRVRVLDFLTMVDLIRAAPNGTLPSAIPSESISLDDVTLLAPIPHPARNIICVGKNYREHAKEFSGSGYEAGATQGKEVDEYPAVFTKPAACVVGPGAVVSLHRNVTAAVDYEAELAVVIGREGANISKSKALDYVFGYTIVNDVTARDRQKNHKQWYLGKSLDTFCPMGPWIVSAGDIEHANLSVKTWVNGELRQNANTSDLIFDVPSLIETLSAGTTLFPGDIISTGTPAGVGIGFKPPRFLQPGDVVKISISGIGEISNTFR